MIDHPDDNFHPPKDADPYWTETSWWSFFVPERKLSGQLYPFFRPNQKIAACAVFLWNDQGDQINTALYARQAWHLPLPDQPLWDITLPNGLHYECEKARTSYKLQYTDPGGEDVSIDLRFEALIEPSHDGHGHLDQPGRFTGTICLDGEKIPVDCYGFRDRSWGRRHEFGRKTIKHGGHQLGYSYATAAPGHGFHALSYDKGEGVCAIVHGYYMRDGVVSPMREGVRDVLDRDARTGSPLRVRIRGTDVSGRSFEAEGRCVNKFGLLLNPNIWTINCLVEWTFDDATAWGEDHDNWTPYGYRRFFRKFLGYDGAIELPSASA